MLPTCDQMDPLTVCAADSQSPLVTDLCPKKQREMINLIDHVASYPYLVFF